MFLIDIRLKKSLIKPLIDGLLYLILFLIDISSCDKVVDVFLSALKFVPDWFVTNKMIKKLLTVLCADHDILFYDKNSGNMIFCFCKS